MDAARAPFVGERVGSGFGKVTVPRRCERERRRECHGASEESPRRDAERSVSHLECWDAETFDGVDKEVVVARQEVDFLLGGQCRGEVGSTFGG